MLTFIGSDVPVCEAAGDRDGAGGGGGPHHVLGHCGRPAIHQDHQLHQGESRLDMEGGQGPKGK